MSLFGDMSSYDQPARWRCLVSMSACEFGGWDSSSGDGGGQVSIYWPKAYQSLCNGMHQRFGECKCHNLGAQLILRL